MATTDIEHYFATQGMRVQQRPTLVGASGEAHTPDLLATGAAGSFFVAVHHDPVAAPDTIPVHLGAQDTGAAPVLVGLKGFTPEAERWAARFGITLLDSAALDAALATAPAPLEAPEPEAPSHAALVTALLAEPAPAEEPLAYATPSDSWDLAYEFPTHDELVALVTPPAPETATASVPAEEFFQPSDAAPEVVAEVVEAPPAETPTIDLSAIVDEVAHILQAHEAPEALAELPTEPTAVEPLVAEMAPAVPEPIALVETPAPVAAPEIEIPVEPTLEATLEVAPEALLEAAAEPTVEAPLEALTATPELPPAEVPRSFEAPAIEQPTVELPLEAPAPEPEPLVTLVVETAPETATAPAPLEAEAEVAPLLVAAGAQALLVEAAPAEPTAVAEAAAPAAPAVDIWGAFAQPKEAAPAPAKPATASGSDWLASLGGQA